MYKLEISSRARRQLKTISKETDKISLDEALADLKENPFFGKALGEELTGRFSYKVGVYRITYLIDIKDKTITIISAGHRSIVYK